jgi:hypothetical protein
MTISYGMVHPRFGIAYFWDHDLKWAFKMDGRYGCKSRASQSAIWVDPWIHISLTVGPTTIHAVRPLWNLILGHDPRNKANPNLRWTLLLYTVIIESLPLKTLPKQSECLFFIQLDPKLCRPWEVFNGWLPLFPLLCYTWDLHPLHFYGHALKWVFKMNERCGYKAHTSRWAHGQGCYPPRWILGCTEAALHWDGEICDCTTHFWPN